MPNNIVVLLHGWASSGDSDKAAFITNALKDFAEVYSPTIDYSQPIVAVLQIKEVCDRIAEEAPDANVVVVGTSLGAWWAEIAGIIENWKSILVNPCFDITSLKKYIGTNTNYATGDEFIFTPEAFEGYVKMQATIRSDMFTSVPTATKTVITATGDDVIPTQSVNEHYQGPDTKIVVYGGGDHRFTDFAYLADAIRKAF